VDHRADIYSLGVVFYQMLTGELPGKRIEPPSHKVLIDVRLDEVVLRALEKVPELRYQHASEVKTMVETIVTTAGQQTGARFYYHNPKRFRDRWLWDYNVLAVVISALMVLPNVLVLSLLHPLGNRAHWFWLFYLLPLSYLAIYNTVARRMRVLRERVYPQAEEMVEVVFAHQTLQTPAVALLTPAELQLIGMAGEPLTIARNDIEGVREIRWFNGRLLWWKMGLRIERRSGTPVVIAIPEPVGLRWMKILQGQMPAKLTPATQPEAASGTADTLPGATDRMIKEGRLGWPFWAVVIGVLILSNFEMWGILFGSLFGGGPWPKVEALRSLLGGIGLETSKVTGSVLWMCQDAFIIAAMICLLRLRGYWLGIAAAILHLVPLPEFDIFRMYLGWVLLSVLMSGNTRRVLDRQTASATSPAEPSSEDSASVTPADRAAWAAPVEGSVRKKSKMVRLIELLFDVNFTSPLAIILINISALGFLAFLAFLGELPLPGMHAFLGFSGFSGFFGLIGFAFMVELAQKGKLNRTARNLPLFVERAGRKQLYWPGLLQVCGTFGLLVIGANLAIALGLWALNGPARMTFQPGELVLLLVLMAACAVMRLAASNLGSSEAARIAEAQMAKVSPSRRLTIALLAMAVAAAAAAGLGLAGHALTRWWRHSAQAAVTQNPSGVLVINRVTVDGDKVVIEGTATTGARIAFYADRRNNGWSCGFNYPDQFTATLEQGLLGLACRVQPRLGKPVLTMNATKSIGDLKLSEGKLTFRAGQPRREADGVWSATIGEFTANSGKKMPVGVLLLPPQAEDLLPSRLTQEGWQLWQAGKHGKAAEKFHEAIRLAPSDANAWNGLGWAQFNDGDSALAEQSFLVAIGIEPNQPGALNGLGQLYLSQRKYADAEKYLVQAAPQASAAWVGLARLYLLQGKFEQAEIWARKIVDSGQADELTLNMLEAAKQRNLSEELRRRIEPPTAGSVK
jgi:hypothetical protein